MPAGKVGKLPLSRARDDVGRGIKAVINYAITRSYLKIKTVFFASMRLTDSHAALTSPSFLLRLPSFLPFFLPQSLPLVSLSFRFPFAPIFEWQILLASAGLRRMCVSNFSLSLFLSVLQPRSVPSPPRYLMGRVFLPIFLLHPFSQASLI